MKNCADCKDGREIMGSDESLLLWLYMDADFGEDSAKIPSSNETIKKG